MSLVGKENNRTHENSKNRMMIVLMLQAGLAAPMSRENLPGNGFPRTWRDRFPPEKSDRKNGANGLLLLENKSQRFLERSNPKLAKPRYTQNINSSKFLFLFFTKIWQVPCVAFKVLHYKTHKRVVVRPSGTQHQTFDRQ